MRMARAQIPMFAIAGVLASCSSAGGPEVESLTPATEVTVARSGTYRFEEWVRQTSPQVVLQGRITFLPDTVTARLDDAPCRYQSVQQTSTRIVYDCMGTILSIDRQNPARPVEYSLTTTVQVSERVCARYTTEAGIRVCVQWRIEHYDRPERRSGTLSLFADS